LTEGPERVAVRSDRVRRAAEDVPEPREEGLDRLDERHIRPAGIPDAKRARQGRGGQGWDWQQAHASPGAGRALPAAHASSRPAAISSNSVAMKYAAVKSIGSALSLLPPAFSMSRASPRIRRATWCGSWSMSTFGRGFGAIFFFAIALASKGAGDGPVWPSVAFARGRGRLSF